MELVKFELYKIFKQKILYVAFFVLAILSTGFTIDYATDLEKELYKEWEGPLTEEKIQQAAEEEAKLWQKLERMEEGEVFSEEERIGLDIYQSIAMIHNVDKNLERRLEDLENAKTPHAELEKRLLEGVDVSYFSFNKGPRETVDSASFYSILVTGAMLLIGLSGIYTQEYQSGVDNYILSAKKGKRPLMLAKIGAALSFSAVVVILWEMFNFLFRLVQYGADGWTTAIQYVIKYYFSPYGFNMLEFHFIQLGFQLLASFSFALMIVLVSSLCKHTLTAFLISGAIFALPYFVVELIKVPNWLEEAFHFSFIYIMKVEFLFENFKALNLFGFPVLYPVAALIWLVALSALFIGLTYFIVNRKEVTS